VILWYSCSSDESTVSPRPVTSVSVEPDVMEVEVGHSAGVTAVVNGGVNKDLTWYVNGIENGNNVVGTVSHNSPATYVAPDVLPDHTAVEVRAVSVEDTTKYDSCMVTITFKVIHVDIQSGDDATGTGYAHDPVKTITRGNQLASAGGTVLAAPGVYDTEHGEQFPIYPKAGVAIVGENWETCIIRGSNAMDYCMSLGAASSAVRKFTFESMAPLGPDRWEHYIYVRGENVRVDSVRTFQRVYYAPIRLRNATNAIIENSVFEVPYLDPPQSGIGMDRAFEIIDGNAGTVIRGCTVSGFREGLRISSDASPLFEKCTITGNDIGIILCCYQSSTHNPNPDLGGGARGSTGGNKIVNNLTCGLQNDTYNVIYAKYNTWTNNPPVAGEDYCNSSTGGVVVE
jgi:hypothetical protein